MTPPKERIEKLKTFIGLAREVRAHAMGMQAICPDRSVAALIGCVAELERKASCELQELLPSGRSLRELADTAVGRMTGHRIAQFIHHWAIL